MPVYLPRKPLPTDESIEQKVWSRRRPYAVIAFILLVIGSMVIPPFAGGWHTINMWRHQLFHEEPVSILLSSVGPARTNPTGSGWIVAINYIEDVPMAVASVSQHQGKVAFASAQDAEKFVSAHSPGMKARLFRSKRDAGIMWTSSTEIRQRGIGGVILIAGVLGVGGAIIFTLARGREIGTGWGRGDDQQTHLD